jgi:hypothetical protein
MGVQGPLCNLGIGSALSLYEVLESEVTLGPTASETSDTGASLSLSGRGGDSVSSGLNVSTDLVFRLVFRVNHRELRRWLGSCSRMLVADLDASDSRPLPLACSSSTSVSGTGWCCSFRGLRRSASVKVCRFLSWAVFLTKGKLVVGFLPDVIHTLSIVWRLLHEFPSVGTFDGLPGMASGRFLCLFPCCSSFWRSGKL